MPLTRIPLRLQLPCDIFEPAWQIQQTHPHHPQDVDPRVGLQHEDLPEGALRVYLQIAPPQPQDDKFQCSIDDELKNLHLIQARQFEQQLSLVVHLRLFEVLLELLDRQVHQGRYRQGTVLEKLGGQWSVAQPAPVKLIAGHYLVVEKANLIDSLDVVCELVLHVTVHSVQEVGLHQRKEVVFLGFKLIAYELRGVSQEAQTQARQIFPLNGVTCSAEEVAHQTIQQLTVDVLVGLRMQLAQVEGPLDLQHISKLANFHCGVPYY
jgi:hypothetical protein